METKTVNLRDLPVDLVRQAKAYAALRGMTLKEFVIQSIVSALQKDIPAMPGSTSPLVAFEGEDRRRKKAKKPRQLRNNWRLPGSALKEGKP